MLVPIYSRNVFSVVLRLCVHSMLVLEKEKNEKDEKFDWEGGSHFFSFK